MKTTTLTKLAMLCALFGTAVALNVQSGLVLENYFPWILSLPIFIAALVYDAKASLTAMAAMMVLSCISGSWSTVLCSGAFLGTGWVYGYFLQKQKPMAAAFFWSTLLLFLLNWLSLTLLSAVFGYDPADDAQMFAMVSSYISVSALMAVSAMFLSVLQSLVMYLLSVLMVLKLPLKKKIVIPRLRFWQVPAWAAWALPVLLFLFIGLGDMIKWSVVFRDIAAVLLLADLILLDYAGLCRILSLYRKKKQYLITFFIMAGFFLPVVSGVYILVGFVSAAGLRVNHNS